MLYKASNKDDFKLIENLARTIWLEHYIPIIGREQTVYMLSKFQTADAIACRVFSGKSEYYIIDDKSPAGYFSFDIEDDGLFLSKLYVAVEYRGRGHAKSVFRLLEKIALSRNIKRIFLRVHKNNKDSIDTYKHMGFRISGSVLTDIGEGFVMDDYCLEKILDNKKAKKTLDVAGAYIVEDGKFLLCKRKENDTFGGLWEFPGGCIESGETAFEAIEREIFEETGLVVHAKEKLSDFTDENETLKIYIEFIKCVIISGVPYAKDCDSLGFFDFVDAAKLELAPADIKILEYIRRNPY
ncbi:MAG: bifunctional GNAT family N-acetyltransferase/NUDIX hydrolase [Candidatus Omnitrophica bacterium]|nr:bifunctional GNAT family N-acetyltransferase/NUDIX hydrolase [Candidatus Omnitrophota bacterium]MDD5080771.1 bifunctional GNAT family N-acetyltransferase/NUDIX hydrolase [Candidatus Omnitrophota bacterium]MDD5440903.1 bifunctional GNAT family N-acetyltransferase/NUDIX hydrolase [Candidatus Omnitrophota bacterium]